MTTLAVRPGLLEDVGMFVCWRCGETNPWGASTCECGGRLPLGEQRGTAGRGPLLSSNPPEAKPSCEVLPLLTQPQPKKEDA